MQFAQVLGMNAAQNPLNVCPYWVEDVLITMSKIPPQQRWPGTSWVQITDCMLRAADESHPAGSTGGAWEVVQTVEQMPKHSHFQRIGNKSGKKEARYVPYEDAGNVTTWESEDPNTETSKTGGNQPMPIVNKYTAFYMWQRTG